MLTEVDRPVITVAVGCGNVKSELRNGKASHGGLSCGEIQNASFELLYDI